MTKQTSQEIASILNGIGLALFTCIGLGGLAIAGNFAIFWGTLVAMVVLWVASRFLVVYAEETNKDND